MKYLSPEERGELIERVYRGLEERGENAARNDWFDSFLVRVAKRTPRLVAERLARREAREQRVELPEWAPRDPAWYQDVVEWALDELVLVRLGEDFKRVEKVTVHGDNDAFSDMAEQLTSQLKIKGMLYNRGVRPEEEYPRVLTKIWEASFKWDGRDFRAYISRTVKNYCIDVLKARRKAMSEIPDGLPDHRPGARTRDKSENRDAIGYVLQVLEALEEDGTLGPLDCAIFSLILSGRGVTELVEQLKGGSVVASLTGAASALTKKRLSVAQAAALRYLMAGLSVAEAAGLTALPEESLNDAAAQLGGCQGDLPLAQALCRARLSLADLKRAAGMTTNAVNLRVNRLRLKIWMALLNRSFDQLKRRGAIGEVDEAIIRHRCTVQNAPLCRMYKNESCKRERGLNELLAASELQMSGEALAKRMESLRDTILDDLGRILPDYNSCLHERKPAE